MCEITAYPDYCCFKNPFKPVTHVLFDLDGTLLDTESINNHALGRVLKEFDFEYTDELHHEILGVTENQAAEIIIGKFDLPLSVEEFVARFQEESYKNLPEATFMPGAEELIRHLDQQQIPMAIGTGSSEESVEMKFKDKQEIYNMLDHVVCASTDEDVLRGKPAPDVWIVAARRFPERPRRKYCLVFEDAYHGTSGALACGMQVVLIPDETMPYDKWKDATLRVGSMTEFMEIMELFGLPPLGAPIPEKKEKKEKRKPQPPETISNDTTN